MHDQIFVNLPIKDLPRSVKFFESLGYTFNPQFTDENATCMVLGENLFAMLLVESYFRSFTDKDVSDAHRTKEVLLAVPVANREAVDALAGGHNILVITDRRMDRDNVAIPALLALSAIHHHLVRAGQRTMAGLVVETGFAREVHHFAVLAGYGAEAIHPS